MTSANPHRGNSQTAAFAIFAILGSSKRLKRCNRRGVTVAGVDEMNLIGISLGAVLMGARTYIGHGPNFMVRAIAEKSGVKIPSFFGSMVYSCVVLLPLFALMTWLVFLFPY